MKIALTLWLVGRERRRLEREINPTAYDPALSNELALLISAIEILEEVR